MQIQNLKLLTSGIKQLKLPLEKIQQEQLIAFVSFIIKWNKTHNLTAIRSERDIIIKHILDSLSIIYFINNDILDVGSGAGLPGIVIAIVRPQIRVSLLDSANKKCNFMRFLVAELGLKNTAIINTRVENYKISKCYKQIICRGFAGIDNTIKLTKHLLCSSGAYLLMKSDKFLTEKYGYTNFKTHNIAVPHLSKKRYLLEVFAKKTSALKLNSV